MPKDNHVNEPGLTVTETLRNLWAKYSANRLTYAIIYISSVIFWCIWAFQSNYEVHANKVVVASDLFGASTGTAVITIALIEGVDLMLSRILIREAQEKGLEQGIEKGREQGIEKGREQGIEKGLEQGREQGLEQGREQARKEYETKLREWAKAKGIDPSELPSLSNDDR